MAKQTVTIDAEVPDGFRAIAFRKPLANEFYEHGGRYCQAIYDFSSDCHLILEKIEPVRESRWIGIANIPDMGFESLESLLAVMGRDSVPFRVDLENGKVVNVALEPAEGGGA